MTKYCFFISISHTSSISVLNELRELLSSTKIDLPVDINDPYDLGLLLRHLRHHSDLLANIGNPEVKQAVLDAMNEEDNSPAIEGAGDGEI